VAGDADARVPLEPLRLLGALSAEQLAEHRRRAAIFAAPARYEPFGLAILEAARDGCALVLGDIPSLRELWEGAAVFVDPEDVAGLREQLRRLLAEPRTTAELGRRARRHSARYDLSGAAHAHWRLYQQLATSSRPVTA
jgi:glycosyltransferase involved in cell wall biosynthesis